MRCSTDLPESDGGIDDELSAGRAAVLHDPRSAQALFNLGSLHAARLELSQAAECYRAALRLDANHAAAHLELGHALLLQGQFQRGWIEYEWRFHLESTRALIPAFPKPQWNGNALADGRILLVGDQGYGDTIQFGRYIPLVRKRCAEVFVGCSPELASLIATIEGVSRCFVRLEHIPPFDAYRALSSLPGLFGTDLATIPSAVPYLRSDPEMIRGWAERLGSILGRSKLRVGIVWAGRPSHPNDRQRSMRCADFLSLASVSDVALISLQKEVPADDRMALARADVLDLSSALTDFAQLGGVVENLDLVVTVDTSTAHLTGALGKPVWILLPWAPDWRWMLDREDSPWYPTARLFRQAERGRWKPVIERVTEELRMAAAGERARSAR